MKLIAWIEDKNEPRLRPPVEIENAKQVIIRDEIGQPLMVLIQHGPDRIWLTRQGDPDFGEALAAMGVGPEAILEVNRSDVKRDIRFPTPKAVT